MEWSAPWRVGVRTVPHAIQWMAPVHVLLATRAACVIAVSQSLLEKKFNRPFHLAFKYSISRCVLTYVFCRGSNLCTWRWPLLLSCDMSRSAQRLIRILVCKKPRGVMWHLTPPMRVPKVISFSTQHPWSHSFFFFFFNVVMLYSALNNSTNGFLCVVPITSDLCSCVWSFHLWLQCVRVASTVYAVKNCVIVRIQPSAVRSMEHATARPWWAGPVMIAIQVQRQ